MLVLQRKKGEAVKIGKDITITISDIGPDSVRIAIDAPREISILRSELAEAVQANREAAHTGSGSLENLKMILKKQKENGINEKKD